MTKGIPTKALVGLIGSARPPGSVVVEGLALVAVRSLSVVLAATDEPRDAVACRRYAFTRVTVTLASASNGIFAHPVSLTFRRQRSPR